MQKSTAEIFMYVLKNRLLPFVPWIIGAAVVLIVLLKLSPRFSKWFKRRGRVLYWLLPVLLVVSVAAIYVTSTEQMADMKTYQGVQNIQLYTVTDETPVNEKGKPIIPEGALTLDKLSKLTGPHDDLRHAQKYYDDILLDILQHRLIPAAVIVGGILLLAYLLCRVKPHYADMLRYIGNRLLMFIPTILIISLVIFFIIQLPPGDYVDSYVGALAAEGEIFTVEEIEDLRESFGLNTPWLEQYARWILEIIAYGDFGYSFEEGRDVWAVIMDYLPLTMIISIIILLFQYGVSLPIGIYCANHQYSAGDYVFSFIGFIGTATPNFLLAIIILYYMYVSSGNMYLGLFSLEMQQAGGLSGLTWATIPEFLGRCAIPLIVIGTSGTCGIIRTVRAQMLDEKARQYTLCARAKGCSEATITYKYCLRAALNPVVSGLSGSLRTIFSGSTVSAMVMNLHILGPILLTALKSQDMYLAGTIVLVQAVLVLVGTLLSDIALAWLDPRIRFTERS